MSCYKKEHGKQIKGLVILLSFVLGLVLAACGETNTANESSNEKKPTASEVEKEPIKESDTKE